MSIRSMLSLLLLANAAAAAEPVVLEQVVSRHDPAFDVARARLAVGRDGNIYLGNGHGSAGHVLRVSPDGKARLGGAVGYSFTAVAVDANGTLATSEAHFAHRTAFWAKDFAALGHVPDFLVSDAVQWNAPSDIAAGADGFYAIDQHRLRVLKVVAPDKLAAAFPLDKLGVKSNGGSVGLRVDEARKRFITAWSSNVIHCSNFDGTPLWNLKLRPAGEPPGAFDLDADGNLFVLAGGDSVQIFDPKGTKTGDVKLAAAPGSPPIHDLRILGDTFIVKRDDPKTLFETYDRRTGAFVWKVAADVEVLRAEYASPVWTAGTKVPFKISFDAGMRPVKPNFQVLIRPLGTTDWTVFLLKDGFISLPKNRGGLYHVRVSPDVAGRVTEYVLDGVVEIRVPDAVGSISIATPLNRFYYGAGEPVPFTVIVRAKAGTKLLESVTVSLEGTEAVKFQQTVAIKDGKGEGIIPADKTAFLKEPEMFARLEAAEVPGFTIAKQHLEFGPGLSNKPAFRIVQHGDYTHGFPPGPRPYAGNVPNLFDTPDVAQDHLRRSGVLKQNLFVDRLGHQGGLGEVQATRSDAALIERLKSDPIAVAPEKAVLEGPFRRMIAGYGANGIQEQGIGLYMDAGLPVGTLFDNRKPEQMEKDLRATTAALESYPAFRGWSWAANWWLEKHGAAAAISGEEKKLYEAALKAAKETGAWSTVLETVSDRTFAHAVEAEKRFRTAVPKKISAMTGPYRAIQTHPPIIFRNADEVDLHYQGEQVQPPQVTPHHVDFYKRPGKPAWGHPELWNDDGTGGMIFPTLYQMAMRGADGVGQSGPTGPWSREWSQADPRSGAAGTTSAFRAAYESLSRLAPLLEGTEKSDRVAIVVSTRMQRIETWDGKIGGAYFDALFEAYNACLYAHRPASFVFVEDLQPDTFKKFQAVLVVNQRVELDPPLKAALANGPKVYFDDSCRPEPVKGFAPLGMAFDKVKSDPSAWQDDAAYHRFPRYFKEHAAALRKVLAEVKPVAECDQPEVMLSERRKGDVRYIWAVNNTMIDAEPGIAWRTNLLITQRVPVIAKLKFDMLPGDTVIDLTSGKEVPVENGTISCDLRTVPARVYALLPKGFIPPMVKEPVVELFGPHIRGSAISADSRTALFTAFNHDHNVYAVDVATGETKWRAKIGHGFAFDPQPFGNGFVVQGFDADTASGYHLYRLTSEGKVEKRFAFFGLPKRATGWASGGQILEPGINSFAVSAAGKWVAAAGDLGLVVWDAAGKELWSDEWWKTTRKRVRLVTLDEDTIVVLEGTIATARSAKDGAVKWSIKLADTGSIRGGAVSADGKTLVVNADTLGGRQFVIHDGKLANTIAAAAEEVTISADGSLIVATEGNLLKAFDSRGGLLWAYTGDDVLRNPRIRADGKCIAAGSELGTLVLLDSNGVQRLGTDLKALPVPAFLPDGDVVAATWMGKVCRLSDKPKWGGSLVPTETDASSKLFAKDATPTVRKTGWGNVSPQPLPLTPNLLAQSKAIIGAVHDPKTHGDPIPWKHKVELLTDGKPEAPIGPWLEWTNIGFIDSGWVSRLAIEIDTFRTQLRVTGITFVEDAAHPESWLRDVRLQWWDAVSEVWRDGPLLLSDAAVHSHVFEKPIEAARFRLVSTGGGTWPIGNIRLGELVFHGEMLGSSHPDAVAKRPEAVLFDEKESDAASLKYPGRPFQFSYEGAFSGGKCLELSATGETGPAYLLPFGHAIPNWDFEIAENPKPGQYRYLRFAWKASSDKTTGMGLLLGRAWPGGGVAVLVGDAGWKEGVIATRKVDGKPPTEWREVTVDLWAETKGKPPRIQALSLISNGGGAKFDKIVLSAK